LTQAAASASCPAWLVATTAEAYMSPRSGQTWSGSEDDDLIENLESQCCLNEIARLHQRTASAVRSRIAYLYETGRLYVMAPATLDELISGRSRQTGSKRDARSR